MKFQLTIECLKNLIEVAEQERSRDYGLSTTIEFELKEDRDQHNGSDKVKFTLKSSYQDGKGAFIGHS